MKSIYLIITLLLSINIFGCKCNGDPNLKKSFEYADFVFMGNVFEFTEVPSGFKTVKNALSNVKIEKIYKSNYFGEYYKNDATLFGSPLRNCDILFNKNGRYLIFAYYEEDTGFLYSDRCLYTRSLDELSAAELKSLDILSEEFNKEVEVQNSKYIPDSEDLIVDTATPNRRINKLKKEIHIIKEENINLKIIVGIILSLTFLCLIVFFLILRKRKNSR